MKHFSFDIDAVVDSAEDALLGPEATPIPIILDDTIRLEKNQLPAALREAKMNIYALWGRPKATAKWRLMYIGQRHVKACHGRISQHVFLQHEGTASKLAEVSALRETGAEIGVTAILVTPNCMRLAVEEELINRNSPTSEHLAWNKKGRIR